MSEFIERQKPVIERTGMGLLPGMAVALALAMGLIAAIVIETWWVAALVLGGVFVISATVIGVIFKLLGSDDEIYSADSK